MILVTGASGLIGRALVDALAGSGVQVRAQGRSRESLAAALVEWHGSPLVEQTTFDFAGTEEADYRRLVDGCNSIIHCAGIVHQPSASREAYAVYNVRATKYLADAAVSTGVGTFMFLSTSAVYGDGPFENLTEGSQLNPQTPYALSKANCEQALSRVELSRMVVLRPSLVFGEGDRGNMQSLIKQIDKGLYFHIGGNRAQKSVIYSADVARAILMCQEKLQPGRHIFNVANPQPVSVVELADTIALLLGRPALPVVPAGLVRAGALVAERILGSRAPLTLAKMEKLMTTTTLSVSSLLSVIGFAPAFSLQDALRREIGWLKSNIKSTGLIMKST